MSGPASLIDALISIGIARIVLLCVLIFAIYKFVLSRIKYNQDVQFGKEHGCQPAQHLLTYKWPFAIDVIKRGFAAGRQKRLLGLFTDYFAEYGTTVQVDLLGGSGFATMEPENIDAILSDKFEDFHLGPRSWGMTAMVGEGIFTQDGPAWKHSRELLRHHFAGMRYQNLEGFRVHVEDLIQTLRQQPDGPVELQRLFYRLTLNTTIDMILGQPVESFRGEVSDDFGRSFDKASLVTGTRVRLGDLYYIYRPAGFTKACSTIKAYVEGFVQTALKTGKEADTDSYIDELYKETGDVSLVRDQVLNVLLAGRDTTAAAVAYVFRLLIRHPRCFEKLRSEVQDVLRNDDRITRSLIQRMPYLAQVIKETLRIYPPVPINSRFCKQTSYLPRGGGPDGQSPLLVREGMPVAYAVYHMHRREDIYGEDALEFRPERWDSPELANIKWGYLPFNGGPRVCLGKDFALMLISYAVARVVQAFPDLHMAPGTPQEAIGAERQKLNLTLSDYDGINVVLR